MKISNAWRFTLENLKEYGTSGVDEADFKHSHKLHRAAVDQMYFSECHRYVEEFGDHKIRITDAGRAAL